MTWEQILVLVVFLSTIFGLAFTNKRPASVFAASMLLLLLTQQLSLEAVLKNVTNTGLVTLVLLLLVSHSIDKTAFIKPHT
jgi:TRAP-type mannitol/chloroaromatic compound transport system permease large subunit